MDNAGLPVRQVDIVRMEFTPQAAKRRKATEERARKQFESLHQTLTKKQAEIKLGKLAIGKLKAENKALKEQQGELRAQLTRQKKNALDRERKFFEQLESNRQELAALKREHAGLQEVLLEMEQLQIDVSKDELAALRKALDLAEEQRAKAEKRAKQTDLLRREKQVQEIAIEMLSGDIDELSGEKAKLIEECDRLNRKLSASHKQDWKSDSSAE